ncbi:excinuclease ABC subunit UvrC [Anaerorhabdus furcosa]|uniref:UvrABC system protein C n=1 Tax=Anaerorhabdus furcosa TaxID=118967 RepID=A0A1T4QE66_9FIRM|nr:excinuclease ABC subunit UvrC [Anaerorhabdus furcosa]SKA01926.1 Excinuclease ABC subunit C [Anaerorhabdus furcosa]
MTQDLHAKLQNLPMEPGCYLMKDASGTIIYVGKAKKLKNRVNQYFVGAHDFKTTKMVSNVRDFDFFITRTEKEALLLEINLIKKHRPRFNIMFMDDKTYPYIKLTREDYPTLTVVREAKKDRKSKYFGPFPDATAAHQTIRLLQTLYPLRKCKVMPKKVCLYYHLGQCLGPCEYDVDPKVYQEIVDKITRFLNGDNKEILHDLKMKMKDATEKMLYENAIEYRDLIQSIEHIADKQEVQTQDRSNRDVFSFYSDKGYLSIQGFFIRQGKLLERELSLSPLYGEVEEEFTSFITQYYQKHPLPPEIVLPPLDDIQILEETLETKITVPIKGYRKKLLDLALNNAKNQLYLKFDVIEAKQENDESLMDTFSQLAHRDVHRVEIFDNSHISGAFTVAACVVFDDGKPNKAEYRIYKLHTTNSDVDSMKEVLYRRYYRLMIEEARMPDCILVDGGKQQIDAAKAILDSLGLDIPLFGLVKDDKHNTSGMMNPLGELKNIDKNSPFFFLLTRMQDEVHRFAITYHRKLRQKAQTKSILDEIDGIGEVRKKKLLKHFGSFKQIKNATVEELMEVLPREVAQNVVQILSESNEE